MLRNRHKAEDGKEEEAVNEKAIIAEKRMACLNSDHLSENLFLFSMELSIFQ